MEPARSPCWGGESSLLSRAAPPSGTVPVSVFFNTSAFPNIVMRNLCRRLLQTSQSLRNTCAMEMLLTLMALNRSSPCRKLLQQLLQLQLLQKSPLAKQSQYL